MHSNNITVNFKKILVLGLHPRDPDLISLGGQIMSVQENVCVYTLTHKYIYTHTYIYFQGESDDGTHNSS